MRHCQSSCTASATASPRPNRWYARIGCSYRVIVSPGIPARPPTGTLPVISTTAPGFSFLMRFTAVTDGMDFHFSVAVSFAVPICVTACAKPAGVSEGARSAKKLRLSATAGPSTTNGIASASGVPAYPPSENEWRPPSCSSPPPRTLTKSVSMASWSCVKKLASMSPSTTAVYL